MLKKADMLQLYVRNCDSEVTNCEQRKLQERYMILSYQKVISFVGMPIFYSRNKDVISKDQVEIIEYLSESPEEKTTNRNELCEGSNLS